MKTKQIIFLSLIMLTITVISAYSGPKELSENQMTDVTVDDTISDNDPKKSEVTDDANKKVPPSSKVINIIKNPVDDPVELNKGENIRFENQAAEQRVNDQIRDSLKGIPPGN